MLISLESRKLEWPSRKSMFEPLPLCRFAAMRRSLLRRFPLARMVNGLAAIHRLNPFSCLETQ